MNPKKKAARLMNEAACNYNHTLNFNLNSSSYLPRLLSKAGDYYG